MYYVDIKTEIKTEIKTFPLKFGILNLFRDVFKRQRYQLPAVIERNRKCYNSM